MQPSQRQGSTKLLDHRFPPYSLYTKYICSRRRRVIAYDVSAPESREVIQEIAASPGWPLSLPLLMPHPRCKICISSGGSRLINIFLNGVYFHVRLVTGDGENTSEPDQKSESRGKEVPLARTDLEKRISLNPRRSINVTSIAVGDGGKRERERGRVG